MALQHWLLARGGVDVWHAGRDMNKVRHRAERDEGGRKSDAAAKINPGRKII